MANKNCEKTDTIDELINFVNVHAKRRNDHIKMTSSMFPTKKNRSRSCKQLPVVETNLLDNIYMIYVSVTDFLCNSVLQAAMQPCHTCSYKHN